PPPPGMHSGPAGIPSPPTAEESAEAGTSRVSFRPPQHLKARLEQAADAEGLSMNAYLVRALTAHLDTPHGPDPHTRTHPRSRTRGGTGRTSGWYISPGGPPCPPSPIPPHLAPPTVEAPALPTPAA